MKKSLIVPILLVSILTFFVACTPAPQVSTIEKVLAEKNLVIGTTGEQFPFSFKDDNGELAGIDIKIAKNLAQELGVKATFAILPFDQLIPAVKEGRVDIVFSGVSVTTLRNTEVAFPGVYYKSGKSIVSKSQELANGKAEKVNTKDVTLAVTKGSTSATFASNKYPQANLVLVNNITEAVSMINQGTAHGLVTDFETAELISFAYMESDFRFKNLATTLEQEFISPVVSADDQLFINLISNYIVKINSADEFGAVDKIWRELLN